MGAWGAGIAQSDEYCEIYDSFMEKYDAGASVEVITEEILKDYLAEFDADDGVLHDVYFALAKGQWMCGALSEAILETVRDIIRNGKNLDFLRELEANDRFLRQRKTNLNKFLTALETPRKTPRKRKSSSRGRQLPPADIGDVFSYKGEAGHRIVVVLDHWDEIGLGGGYFCCILARAFRDIPIVEELNTEMIGQIGVYDAASFLPASKIRPIGHLEIPPNKYQELFGDSILLGCREDFYTTECTKQQMTFGELLKAKNMGIFDFMGQDK